MSFTLRNATATNQVSYAFRDNGDGTFTYNVQRYFVQYDLTGSGYTASGISAVDIIINITAVAGSGSGIKPWVGSSGDNWGATLEGNDADYRSTDVNLQTVTSTFTTTGIKTISIDKNDLDYNAVNYFRFDTNWEVDGYPGSSSSITFHSGNNANGDFFPLLRITFSTGAVKDIIAMGFIPFSR